MSHVNFKSISKALLSGTTMDEPPMESQQALSLGFILAVQQKLPSSESDFGPMAIS